MTDINIADQAVARSALAWMVAVCAATFVTLITAWLPPFILGGIRGTAAGADLFVTWFVLGWLGLTLLGAIIGAIPSWVAIRMIRESGAARPVADICAALLIVQSVLLLPSLLIGTSALMILLVAVAGTLGSVVGGWTYWEVAGRPRPPYAQR